MTLNEKMTKIPVIIDTDPGVDDTIALLLSMASEDLDIRLITTVGGNVELKYTSQNAKNIVKLAGKDIPVAKGATGPMYKELTVAAHIHGINGMGTLELEPSDEAFLEGAAEDLIYEEAIRCKGNLRILTLGPMTNIGKALKKYPDLPEYIHSIVSMGGAMGVGNVTPAAEFNIYADPDAASLVYDSGIKVTMVGLDVTVPTVVTKDQNDMIRSIDNPIAQVIADLNDYALSKEFMFNPKGAIMHDPLSAAALIDPSVITTRHCNVLVECDSELTRGATMVDAYGLTGREANVHVAFEANSAKFFELLIKMIHKYDRL